MMKKIMASLMAVVMLASVPADAMLAAEAGTSTEIIWLDAEEEDTAASASANVSDMLDDDDMFVGTDASEAETDSTEEETDTAEAETDSTEDSSGTDAADLLDDDDMFVDAEPAEAETDTSESDAEPAEAETDTLETDLEAAASETASGSCGADTSNLTWTLVNGVLTISGTGEMATYAVNTTSITDSTTNPPWFRYNDTITSVVIESGGDFHWRICVYALHLAYFDFDTKYGDFDWRAGVL
ncbi:MAG: hypothetical protein LUF27_03380 [Lachnospiraceae bacterium]|nr:hypothetical protein [Lachnospiraceae bacterium]